MPLFEVDAERPVLVHPSAPRGGFGTDAQRVVDGNLDSLLGEQIFPVAQGQSVDQPHLLALDAAGLPVVIDVVSELSEETLTRALNHAGAAGQLTRAELGARYTNGAAAFNQDVASFYDNVPLTRSQSAARTTGARLIVICQSATEDIVDALDFLRQPGSPVAVLRLGVVHAEDGRRFVDVSPLAVGRGVVAPTTSPARVSNADFAEGVAVGRALTGKVPVVSRRAHPETAPDDIEEIPTPVAGLPAVPPPPPPPPPPGSAPVPAAGAAIVPSLPTPRLQSRAERRRAQEFGQTTYRVAPTSAIETGPMPSIADPAAPLDTELPILDVPSWDTSEPRVTPRRSILTRESVRTRESIRTRESYLTDEFDFGDNHLGYAAPPTDPVEEPAEVGQQVAHVPPLAEQGLGPDDDPDLYALARSLGTPAQLVWSRPRRGERFDAVLHPDGFIELTDGARFRHPDLAAVAASGTQSADGWSVWRFGEDGPTLTDAFRARYA